MDRTAIKNPLDQRALFDCLAGLVGYATSAIDRHDAHPFADAEHLIGFNLLHVSAQRAVVLTHGDLDALGAGNAFLGCRTDQTTRQGTNDSQYIAALATAKRTAADTAHGSAGT